MRSYCPKYLLVFVQGQLCTPRLAHSRHLVQPDDVRRHQADERSHDRVLRRLGDRQVKQKVLLHRGPSCRNLDAESLQRGLNVGDGRLGRPLCSELRRMHLENAARFGKRLDVVAIEIK